MNGTALTHKTRFEWDRAKAKACYQKHKETFETAAIVFAIITQDRIEGGKCRWQTLGLVDSVGGPHDWRDRKRRRFIRIISACRADLKTSSDILNKPSTHYEIDLSNPPPSTPSQRAEIEALKAMPDRAIDSGDIPPLSDAFWEKAVRKPTKTSTSVRVDSDVLQWLESKGKGCQTRINALLGEAMLNEMEKPPSQAGR